MSLQINRIIQSTLLSEDHEVTVPYQARSKDELLLGIQSSEEEHECKGLQSFIGKKVVITYEPRLPSKTGQLEEKTGVLKAVYVNPQNNGDTYTYNILLLNLDDDSRQLILVDGEKKDLEDAPAFNARASGLIKNVRLASDTYS